MKQLTYVLIFLLTLPSVAQQSITLEACYNLVQTNYPLAKQTKQLEEQNKLDAEVISTSKLPQVSLEAQATYQSAVITFPVTMPGIEPLDKDQYRATVSVNQLIYNGGATEAALDLKTSQLKTKQKQVEVSLYQLKQNINQLYFSILLAQESKLLLIARQKQLESKLKEVQSGISNGVLVPTSDSVLQAELLKISQQFKDVESNQEILTESLSQLLNFPLNSATVFNNPIIETQLDTQLNRPEMELFQLKKEEIETTEKVLEKQNMPKFLGFATGGYGSPGLDILDNAFQAYYIVGVKLNWNVFDWNANKKQRESLAMNKDFIDNETEVFTLNTNIELNAQQKEIDKIEAFIISDMKIVNLRKTVLNAADSQLRNGVITASAYITELTNLYEDENTLVKHKIQLQLAKANYNVIKG